MRKWMWIFLSVATSLSAQEVGEGAATGAQVASNWENWAFASTAVVTVAAGVFAVALSPGTSGHH